LDYSFSIRIPDNLSRYVAEAVAIHEAIKLIQIYEIDKVVVVSDALNVLKDICLNSSIVRPHLINVLYILLSTFSNKVTLLWVPSHCGITNHDKADMLAKRALSLNIELKVDKEVFEINKQIDKHYSKLSIDDWNRTRTGQTYKEWFPLTFTEAAFTSMPRIKERLIGRLRLNCSKLNHHLFKINLHNTGLCDVCSELETTEHFLMRCTKTIDMRKKLKEICVPNNIIVNPRNILSISSLQDVVFKFCTSNNYYI